MKIVEKNPPNLEAILEAGMQPNMDTVVFTHGDMIYNPGGCEIVDHVMEHEETHCDQQGDDPDAWWDRYISDVQFRVEQETEAYANQYAYFCGIVKERERRNRFLMMLAKGLSSPMYGEVVDHQGAMKLIREKANV